MTEEYEEAPPGEEVEERVATTVNRIYRAGTRYPSDKMKTLLSKFPKLENSKVHTTDLNKDLIGANRFPAYEKALDKMLRSFVQLSAAAMNVTMLALNRLETSTDFEAVKHLLTVVEMLGQQSTLVNETRRKYLKPHFVEEHQAAFVSHYEVQETLYCPCPCEGSD